MPVEGVMKRAQHRRVTVVKPVDEGAGPTVLRVVTFLRIRIKIPDPLWGQADDFARVGIISLFVRVDHKGPSVHDLCKAIIMGRPPVGAEFEGICAGSFALVDDYVD